MKAQNDLIKSLLHAAELHRQGASLSDINKLIHTIILTYGSETEGNLNLVNQVVYEGYEDETSNFIRYGFRLKGSSMRLAEVCAYAESSEVPDYIKAQLPFITQVEWEACMRLVTLLFTSLENTMRKEYKDLLEKAD